MVVGVMEKLMGKRVIASYTLLDVYFLYYAIRKYRAPGDQELPMKTFGYSISYLGFLFAAVLIDHYLLLQLSL